MADKKDADRRKGGQARCTPIVGTLGATPKLSADPQLTTTPVTVTGEQAGGTILLDTGQVAYTARGRGLRHPRRAARPDHHPRAVRGEAPPPGQVRMIDRASAPGAPDRVGRGAVAVVAPVLRDVAARGTAQRRGGQPGPDHRGGRHLLHRAAVDAVLHRGGVRPHDGLRDDDPAHAHGGRTTSCRSAG